MRKVKKKVNKKFKWLIRMVAALAIIFISARLYFIFFDSESDKSNMKIGTILTSSGNDLMLDSAIYYSEDKMIEVRFVYDTGSLTNPNQLVVKAKQTNNVNKKYQLKNVKVTPNYYVVFIPKVDNKHFNISLNVSGVPIENEEEKSTNFLGGTTFDTIKLTQNNVKVSNKFSKEGSGYYQTLSNKGNTKLQKLKVKSLDKKVKELKNDNKTLLNTSYKMFDNVSQMTYDDVKTLGEYIRSNNQKVAQTQSKVNELLVDKSKIYAKIKAINNITE